MVNVGNVGKRWGQTGMKLKVVGMCWFLLFPCFPQSFQQLFENKQINKKRWILGAAPGNVYHVLRSSPNARHKTYLKFEVGEGVRPGNFNGSCERDPFTGAVEFDYVVLQCGRVPLAVGD